MTSDDHRGLSTSRAQADGLGPPIAALLIVLGVALGVVFVGPLVPGADEEQPETAYECELVPSEGGNITFIFCDATDEWDGKQVTIENRSVESGNVTLEGLND